MEASKPKPAMNKKVLMVIVIARALILVGLGGYVLYNSGGIGGGGGAGPSTVNLRSAGDFVILAKPGISTTGTTSIDGDIGISPAAASFITGFGLTMDSSNKFATSSLVTGRVYGADYE